MARGIVPDYCFIYETKPLHTIKRKVEGCRYITRNEVSLKDCELLGPGCPAVSLAWGLGFRSFDLFGFDMCHADTTHIDGDHAYSFIDEVVCEVGGRKYHTNHRLLYHLRAIVHLIRSGIDITIHGDSLMAVVAKDLSLEACLPDSKAWDRAYERWISDR